MQKIRHLCIVFLHKCRILVEATGDWLRQSVTRNLRFAYFSFYVFARSREPTTTRVFFLHVTLQAKNPQKPTGFCGFLVEATGFEATFQTAESLINEGN